VGAGRRDVLRPRSERRARPVPLVEEEREEAHRRPEEEEEESGTRPHPEAVVSFDFFPVTDVGTDPAAATEHFILRWIEGDQRRSKEAHFAPRLLVFFRRECDFHIFASLK